MRVAALSKIFFRCFPVASFFRVSFLPFVGFVAMVFALWGCGPEVSTPSAKAVERPSTEARPHEKLDGSAAAAFFRGKTPADVAAGPKAPPTPASRLKELGEQLQGGANPATVEILYEALNDPDPVVRHEVENWLRLLVEQDEEARKKLETLQGREYNRDTWQRAGDLLAPREVPVEITPPTEETSEENG